MVGFAKSSHKLIGSFIKNIKKKRLVEKTLMNCEPFLKFVKVSCQTFVLYGYYDLLAICEKITLLINPGCKLIIAS